METLAEKIINFNRNLVFLSDLPNGIKIMNPFVSNPNAFRVSSMFYQKYYNDNKKRKLILGINPGRHGAGITGVPFTDTKRLMENCGLEIKNLKSYEVSSVFVYDMIDAYGGVEKFYENFYINSPSPLGYTITKNNKDINYNYYDSSKLLKSVEPFIMDSILKHAQILELEHGKNVCFCLGTGKNYKHLQIFNEKLNGLFKQIIPLEHPRYIMQYKSKNKNFYIDKYIKVFQIN